MSRRSEVLVGLVIVLGIVVAVVGTIWLQGYQWRQSTTAVEARFREVGQLQEGNAVKVRGVSIGRVESIRVEEGGRGVRVTMRIRDDVQLPDEAVVLLAPESMFGDWQAEILPGSRYAQFDYAEVPEGSELLPGHALPDISHLTATVGRVSENLAVLTERFEVAFTEETARNVRRAIENITEVSDELTTLVEQQGRSLNQLSSSVAATSEDVSAAASSARRVLEGIERATGDGRLDTLVTDATATVENIRALTGEMDTAVRRLEAAAGSVDTTFRRIDRLAAGLEAGEGALGRMLRDTLLYVRAERAFGEIDALIADFRENPRKYINLSIF